MLTEELVSSTELRTQLLGVEVKEEERLDETLTIRLPSGIRRGRVVKEWRVEKIESGCVEDETKQFEESGEEIHSYHRSWR